MGSYADVVIRDATGSDELDVECIMSTYFLDMDEVPIDDFIIAEVGGKVVGVAALIERECCEVHSVAVHPNYRGNGIGSKMVSSLIKDSSSNRVYVRTTSPLFFRKIGFLELPASEKKRLWEDCRQCDRLDRCKQHVMFIEEL